MPLDHVNGECIDGLDIIYRIVPISKYQELPGLTTVVEVTEGKKFKRKKFESVPVWQAAENYAKITFCNSGAPAGQLGYDILVQEYPRTHQVAFIFCAEIFGHEQFVVAPFELSQEQVTEMKAIAQWEDIVVN